MEEQLLDRLEQLKEDFATGQRMLVDYQHQELKLRETLLRISGAIQLIEEELGKTAKGNKGEESENAN